LKGKVGAKLNTPDDLKNKAAYLLRGKNIIRLLVLLALLAGYAAALYIFNKPDEDEIATSASKQTFVSARVEKVLSDDAKPDYVRAEGRRLGKQSLQIKILSGEHKGEIMQLANYLSVLFNVDARAGDRIIVRLTVNQDGTCSTAMFNYDRATAIAAFVFVFVALLIMLGGIKGIKALLGLAFTIISLWFLLIPMVMKGYNSLLATCAIVALTTSASFIILDGFTKKVMSAILGSMAGVAAAGLSAALAGFITPLNGFNMTEAETLILQATDNGMKISGLFVCGIIISSLGAVMDVAMSIASSVHELYSLNSKLSLKQLLVSGMNIGRDTMGTMATTIILAFMGSSLNMLILTKAYEIPLNQLFNSDFICIEIIQGVAGSIGIILTVPFVALISASLMCRRKNA